uniref:ribose-phosphate diphosphokinase n=1 Tax=Dermatophagoides pteronyssinus TaxID=6956 RepID=A0A6P6Y4N5_DERPT|nr:26S proteasome regulatory subunit 4 homolog B-like [Dermatophagoides pteronyssinus]
MRNALILAGNSNPALASRVAAALGVPLGRMFCGRFADGEVNLEIQESVKGKEVFIIQSTSKPVNEAVMELCLIISAARRSNAAYVTAIIPYYGYARQDRIMKPGVPISAAEVAKIISAMCPDRVVCLDLHCGQIQGFFPLNIIVDNLGTIHVGLKFFVDLALREPVIVSPDGGGVFRAQKFMELYKQQRGTDDVSFALMNKVRKVANEIEDIQLIGYVKNKSCVIVDDMIDTAGTLCEAVNCLIANGARVVYAFAAHGLFNGKALERIRNSPLTAVVVTDSIAHSAETKNAEPNADELQNLHKTEAAELQGSPLLLATLKEFVDDSFAIVTCSLGSDLFVPILSIVDRSKLQLDCSVLLSHRMSTGKTLLAKAVARETSATFLRIVGSELINKYHGEGCRLVRELFKVAKQLSPSIIFIDEIDAVGTRRYDTSCRGELAVQRIMLELLNQLDGFDNKSSVKIIMATNKIQSLDPALIRSGRIDRKVELPPPDEKAKKKIFEIHTRRMTLHDDVDFTEFINDKTNLSGADIKAICTEAGLLALRDLSVRVSLANFRAAKEKVLYRLKGKTVQSLYA